jgi:hypothetical protein
MEKQASRVALVGRPLRSGPSGFLWKAVTLVTAASLITSLLPKSTRKNRVIAGVLGTAGSLALRYAVHSAGVASILNAKNQQHKIVELESNVLGLVG